MTPQNFELVYRNPNHWDVYVRDFERVAKIRGDKNATFLITESEKTFFKTDMQFPSLESCMTYVCATLMNE